MTIQKTLKNSSLLVSTLLIAACASSTKTQSSGGSSGSYSGLGSESVSPAVLAEFAPKPLNPDLANQVRKLLEVQAPGLGIYNPVDKALYFSWSITGVAQVWKLKNPLGYPEQLTSGTDPTGLVDITKDWKHLILSRDRAGEENPGLYLQSVNGGPLKEIQHKKGVRTTFVHSTGDGSTIFYKANDIKSDSYAIYAYSVGSGNKELIFSEPGLWFVTDVLSDQVFLMGKATGSLTAEFYTFTLRDRKLTPVLGQGEKEEYSPVFGHDMSELLVVTNKFSDFKRLYLYKKGEFKPVTPDVPKDIENIIMSENHRRFFIQWNDGGYAKTQMMDVDTYKLSDIPGLPKSAEQTYVGYVSPKARHFSVGIETGLEPRTSYIFDFQNNKLTQWVRPSLPEIDKTLFVPQKLESYPAADGTKIPMLVTRPRECETKTCPVVVDFHGGPEGQSRPGFDRIAQLYASHGFIYVEPNVRGSDGYGRKWISADDGPKRLSVITDIDDAARYIRKAWAKNGVEPKIGVTGGSYGGYSTLVAMTKFAGAYDAGVSIVGMSDLRSFLLNTAPYRRILRISEYGDPEKDKDALAQLSPITYIDRVKAPLMIIQGVSDPRVPVGEALQMRNALAKKGVEAPLILFADEGHGSAKRDNRVIQIGAGLQFFIDHLN